MGQTGGTHWGCLIYVRPCNEFRYYDSIRGRASERASEKESERARAQERARERETDGDRQRCDLAMNFVTRTLY